MDFRSFTAFLHQTARPGVDERQFLVSWDTPIRLCTVGLDAQAHTVLDGFVDLMRRFDIDASVQPNKRYPECLRDGDIIVSAEAINPETFSAFSDAARAVDATALIETPPSRFGFSTFFYDRDRNVKSLAWVNGPDLKARGELREALVQELFHAVSFGQDIDKTAKAFSILHEVSPAKRGMDSPAKINTSPDGVCRFDLQLLHILSNQRPRHHKEKNLIYIPLRDIGLSDYLLSLIPAISIARDQKTAQDAERILAKTCSWTVP
ncbi:hypothetical protein SAMN04488093_10581 [Tropicibacter naphthalenivorans]|uniref:Uncharacterized protein n=2 Tax=Tropicibacter naphthalenivorans TaxID=441103 RepID=A0A0P1GF36_9RHOB|nr:hypothetical protein TRN7648_02812 [Tropicibacter naphthalenivorans]SMC84597.1 hypothetical protein SAMN04488093_10581 [Tropicibacter naphthalenivorans]